MTGLNLWVHAHPWIVVALALCLGGSLGMLVTALCVMAGDPAQVREAERKAGHW